MKQAKTYKQATVIFKVGDAIASALYHMGINRIEYDNITYYQYNDNFFDPLTDKKPLNMANIVFDLCKLHAEFYRDYYYHANANF